MRYLLIVLVCAVLGGCEKSAPQEKQAAVTDPGPPAAAKNLHPDIDRDWLFSHIEILSSDDFGGRAPATPGEEKTIAYLREQFAALGLEPGHNGSFFQDVPLVTITATTDDAVRVNSKDGTSIELPIGEDAVVWTKRVTPEAAISDSDLVFVGYGIVAPEFEWDDYAGLDVSGKTVVMLVNDPGFASQDPALFKGNAMTYYGRWTYKFEEAAKQGAAGALIIHETPAAGYPWSVVQGSWTGAQHDLVTADKNMSRASIEGWISSSAADKMLQAVGSSYAQLKEEALDRTMGSRELGLSASVAVRNSISTSNSKNVLAKIPGTERPDEYILYMAHWDHLGTDPNLEGDQIYNGAVDNATGTAGLLAIARAFMQQPQKPRRSIMFVAVTAEESGLLGSRHYAENPPVPLNKTVAGVNMDALHVTGPTRDVAVIGYGSSELEKYLAKAALQQNRTIGPEPTPEKGFFYRSDHFNLAKKGVPVLYAKSGVDLVDGGPEKGRALQAEHIQKRYHKPADEINENWNLTGSAEDLQLFFHVGSMLAGEKSFPQWYPGNEFKALRDASMMQ
ncbi:MAG: M28 family peptidase [Gammaproteobacteria bacterium]|nr:M28 family peptidase [Gammaproteobacteria bacterium]